MKRVRLIGLMMGSIVVCAQADQIGYIEQKDSLGNPLTATPIYLTGTLDVGEDEGTTNETVPIPSGGAVYTLYGYGLPPDNNRYVLDQVALGTYLPKATIEIVTQDPNPIPQTRADYQFTVKMVFSDLKNDTDVDDNGNPYPEGAKKMRVIRSVYDYGPTSHRLPDPVVVEVEEDFDVIANGEITKDATTALPFQINPDYNPDTDPAGDAVIAHSQNGEEVFRVYSLLDPSVGWVSTAQATVKVWPIAQGSIEGIEDGGIVYSSVPDVDVAVQDAYTTSEVYLRIYPGEANLNTPGAVIVEAHAPFFQEEVPQDVNFRLENLENYLDGDGKYTIELVTKTPFNNGDPERLATVTFTLDRTVEVNENGGSAE